MTVRRWIIAVALIAVVLSTARIYTCVLPSHGTHYRSVNLGFDGTFLSYRLYECRYEGGSWQLGLINDRGVGPKLVNHPVGLRIIFGSETQPYDLVPALWIRRNVR